jgi:uncharacterized membrane protein
MHSHSVRHIDSMPHVGEEVRAVRLAEPVRWVAAGVRDFAHAPVHSLLYGALFASACALTAALTLSLPWFTVAFLTGLLLMGPYLATGLYVAARQLQAGEPVSIRAALDTLWERRTNLSLFVLFLALIMAAWVRFAALLFAIQFDLFSPSIEGYLGLLRGQGDPVVLAYFIGIGFLLAVTVFVTSAVAVPHIIERDVNPIAAIGLSARAVARNWPAMLVWSVLILSLTAVGLITAFAGFLVLFPVLGYATWHSYRDMVG